MQTRDQKYASGVYRKVLAVKDKKDEKFATSYGSMAHKLPILIHTSGLIQALTFVATRHTSKDANKKKSEGEKGPERLLEDLSKTVLEDESAGKERLLGLAMGIEGDRVRSLQDYIYLTRQVLAALLWYKRYAQSILGVEPGTDDEKNDQGGRGNGGNKE